MSTPFSTPAGVRDGHNRGVAPPDRTSATPPPCRSTGRGRTRLPRQPLLGRGGEPVPGCHGRRRYRRRSPTSAAVARTSGSGSVAASLATTASSSSLPRAPAARHSGARRGCHPPGPPSAPPGPRCRGRGCVDGDGEQQVTPGRSGCPRRPPRPLLRGRSIRACADRRLDRRVSGPDHRVWMPVLCPPTRSHGSPGRPPSHRSRPTARAASRGGRRAPRRPSPCRTTSAPAGGPENQAWRGLLQRLLDAGLYAWTLAVAHLAAAAPLRAGRRGRRSRQGHRLGEVAGRPPPPGTARQWTVRRDVPTTPAPSSPAAPPNGSDRLVFGQADRRAASRAALG